MTAAQTLYAPGERDETFYFDTLTFWVEGTLFKIPRLYFERTSGAFGDMFSLSSGSDNQKQEGSSDENPIHLDAIEKTDFRRLLWVMFPDLNRFAKNRITMGQEEWTSVLKLATLWSMGELRQEAIDALSQLTINPIDKVLLAREYKVGPWLVEAYTELVKREQIPTFEETEKLGWKTSYAIMKSREETYKQVAYAIMKAREETYKQVVPPQPIAPPQPPYHCSQCGGNHYCIHQSSQSPCKKCRYIHCGNYDSGVVQVPSTQRGFDGLDASIRDAFQEELKDVGYGGDAVMAAALEVEPDMAEKLVERRAIESKKKGKKVKN